MSINAAGSKRGDQHEEVGRGTTRTAPLTPRSMQPWSILSADIVATGVRAHSWSESGGRRAEGQAQSR